jgi:hypothetical protein
MACEVVRAGGGLMAHGALCGALHDIRVPGAQRVAVGMDMCAP